ncbi:MAG TPA: gamma-glutamyltransferase [Longimicrobiales bacterium]
MIGTLATTLLLATAVHGAHPAHRAHPPRAARPATAMHAAPAVHPAPAVHTAHAAHAAAASRTPAPASRTTRPRRRPAPAPRQDPLAAGAANPALAADGRLVLEIRGDLWLAPDAGDPARLVRLTHDAALDIEPAWTADGRAIVFASDRAGGFDLWRLDVGADGPAGAPVRLTDSPEPEREPAAAPWGGVVFTRGRRAAADLWLRRPDGTEERLTDGDGGSRMAAVSPDGSRVAYVRVRGRRHELRVLRLSDGDDRGIADAFAVEYPAWSPTGDRIAFTSAGGDVGVWVVSADGGPANLVSRRHARPVWMPDGAALLLAELGGPAPGYNGDPDRLPDRDAGAAAPPGGRLWRVPAPAPIDAGLAEVAFDAPVDAETNAAAFDRAWSRIAELYYAGPGAERRRADWERLRDVYRPRALEARSDAELQGIIHAMLRERPPYRDEAVGRAAVSSAHPLATEAGLEILRKGGNVVDAAVAVSFALGVVEPDASGVGGYGQMLIHLEGMDEPALIEFMTRAPQAATLENGALREAEGPAAANVPGTVDGMWRAWQRYGSGNIEWAELLAPAIRLAEEGFVLDDALPTTLARERERFLESEGARRLFFPDGEPLRPGDTLRNPDLAWTLRQIAEGGADAFYRGEIARRMVEDLRGKGNAMTLDDMARYFAVWREPVKGTYRGHTIYGSAPPVSGGATLVAQLNLLEHHESPRPPTDDAATAHAMIEAWKLVPSTRGRIADPGLWPVNLEPFTSKDTAAARWRCFDPARALTVERLEEIDDAGCGAAHTALGTGAADGSARRPARPAPDPGEPAAPWAASRPPAVTPRTPPDRDAAPADARAPHACEATAPDFALVGCPQTGTTAFAIADADGNMVAVTQTLGTWGGNFYVTPGLGFLYNDKLHSYASDPDAYGARLPYARHGSTISPTLVFRGTGADRRPLLAAGAAGNAWITSAVYQIVTGVIDHRLGPQRALEQPRFLITRRAAPDGGRELVIQTENGFAPEVARRLRALGHLLQPIAFRGELRMGYGAAVVVEDGRVRAGGDPRRSGAGGAVR